MANFWDDLNAQAQQAAMQGANHDWDRYSKMQRVQQVADQRKKKTEEQPKGNLLTSLIPTGGGIGGALAGGAAGAAVGSAVPVVGTAIGGLLGAILGGAGGSALGKVGENAVEGEQDLGKGVAGEALMGGATSLPFTAGLKLLRAGGNLAKGSTEVAAQLAKEAGASAVPRMAGGLQAKAAADAAGSAAQTAGDAVLKTSTKGRMTDLGNKALTSQYGTISKPVARATNPEKTFGQLADAGITKPGDVERMSSSITGSDGIVNKAVLKAVGDSGGVDTSTLRQVFHDAMDNYGIVEGDRKSLTQIFDAQMKRLSGGAAGSLNPLADPNEALGVMKSIEKRMADLSGRGSNYRLTTPERGDKANALGLVKDELQSKLYEGAGANTQLENVLTPQFRDEVLNLMPGNQKWAQYVDNQVMGAKSVGELRSSMAPFVRASKILDEADINSMTFGGRVGDAFKDGGLKNMVAEGATALVKNPAARAASSVLRGIGGAAPGAAPTGAGLLGTSIRQAAPRGLEAALTGSPVSAASQLDQNGLAPEDYQTLDNEGIDPASMGAGAMPEAGGFNQQPANAFGVAPDEVAQAMVRALQAGDTKAFGDLKDLYTLMQTSEMSGSKANATTQKALAQSANGTATIDQLEQLLQQAGGGQGFAGNISNLMGGLKLNSDAQTYNDLARGSVAQIAKALGETGALSDSDIATYGAMIPKLTDDPVTAQRKIAALRQRMANAQNNAMQFGSGSGLEEALASAGYAG